MLEQMVRMVPQAEALVLPVLLLERAQLEVY
jgi:hypothetical protein